MSWDDQNQAVVVHGHAYRFQDHGTRSTETRTAQS
jgi:hypothetical protein